MTSGFDKYAAADFMRRVLSRDPDLGAVSDADLERIAAIVEAGRKSVGKNRFYTMYPEDGPFSRHAFKVHCDFFAAGRRHKERLAMAGNRTGKTHSAAYEFTCHVTGIYPHWWEGRRFEHPIDAWACGVSNETLRDIVMQKLFGGAGKDASSRNELACTGMIPEDHVNRRSARWHTGAPGILDTVEIRWRDTDRYSTIGFKSYEQGRKKFEGTARHVVWMDEEPPKDVYTEALTRTLELNGIVMMTFTPLAGVSDVVTMFLPESMRAIESGVGSVIEKGDGDNRFLIQFGWDDVPHFTPEMIRVAWNSYPPHERRARRYGEPTAGAGRVYQIDVDEISVPPFKIPWSWPRVCAIDPGYNRTAALWGAIDRMSDCVYLYSEYYESEKVPMLNAMAISKRGEWIPCVMDPAGARRGQDGKKAIEQYREAGLIVISAKNALEPGIASCDARLRSGRMKVFTSLRNFRREFGLYRRDDKGKIPDGQDDHLMDCMRYMGLSGLRAARGRPVDILAEEGDWSLDAFDPLAGA